MSLASNITDYELTFPKEWDAMNDDLMAVQDEELSATSNEEANKVFKQWKADEDIMVVDDLIGSNLLDESVFDAPCLSPTGPLEEIVYMNIDEQDQDIFLVPSLNSDDEENSSASKEEVLLDSNKELEKQYRETLKKLAESMKRTQETRKSLKIKTPKTKKYYRSSKVTGVLSSIEKSTKQLQLYLEKSQRNL